MTSDDTWLTGLPIGVKLVSQGRTIGEGEFALLTDLTWTTTELHTNAEYARTTPFGERILGGPVTAALITGLWAQGPHYRLLHDPALGVHIVAVVNMDVTFGSPFFPGDTLRVESELISARPSKSKRDRGVLQVRDRGLNQRDEVVCELTRTFVCERTKT